jgi:FAD dependent oxidoreductase TIGR03364
VNTGTPADLAVVGAGVVGLAHAAEAHRRGLRVTVLDRDQRAVGASIRNFGHLCVTPQHGEALGYALAARSRWLELGRAAGFEVRECGTVVLARSAAEAGVLEEFAAARGADQVRMLTPEGARALVPPLAEGVVAAAHLPLDLRVDPRSAVPALAAWLADEGVDFRFGTHVGALADGVVRTACGDFKAERIVHASGHDVDRLFPAIADEYDVRRCVLQMFEVAPPGGAVIDPAVLTGTSMLRYGGFLATPSASAVRAEIEAATPELLRAGLNLMFTQRPDGAIVLGDTHRYELTHSPFDDEELSALVLREGARLLGGDLTVLRRWRGVYASSAITDFLVAEPFAGARVVSVTSGIGMTTAFGLAPAVLDALL